jgi:SAM-dependent methyltransferase
LEIFLSEYERWEARYAVPEYAFGKDPNYFLQSCRRLLPPSGRALAIADGEGRNGVWLAEQGLDVLSLDFSPSAQKKARALAAERHVHVAFARADVHTWDYPEAAFDVVVEIFTQFSSPAERTLKWAGMRRTLKSGGLLILQGYTPKQLEYGTGGLPALIARPRLPAAFGSFSNFSSSSVKVITQRLTELILVRATIAGTTRASAGGDKRRRHCVARHLR